MNTNVKDGLMIGESDELGGSKVSFNGNSVMIDYDLAVKLKKAYDKGKIKIFGIASAVVLIDYHCDKI